MAQYSSRCPGVYYSDTDSPQGSILPIYRYNLNVEIYMNCAYVRCYVSFLNTTGRAIDGVFVLPTLTEKTVVSSAEIYWNGKCYVATVVDPSDKKNGLKLSSNESNDGYSSAYNPSFFTMPFKGCPANSEIVVEVNYLEDMQYNSADGTYTVEVPTTIPREAIFQNMAYGDIVSINSVITSASPDFVWNCKSHRMVQKMFDNHLHDDNGDGTCIALQLDKSQSDLNNCNFLIGYCAWAKDIQGSAIIEAPSEENPEGSFVLFLAPPPGSALIGKVIGRNLIFLLDHSGSMSGAPMEDAKASLISALSKLSSDDSFNICAFDDRTVWFHTDNHSVADESTPKLYKATPHNIDSAKMWVASITAMGGTDILSSFQDSCNVLLTHQNSVTVSDARINTNLPGGFVLAKPDVTVVPTSSILSNTLNMVILITDGAVSNEQQICEYAKQLNADLHGKNVPAIQAHTFGIGPYCNKYFLRMLSNYTCAHHDSCCQGTQLQSQMGVFMDKTYSPILSNIKIELTGVSSYKIYPETFPDLALGAPVVAAGVYTCSNSFSHHNFIQLSGVDAKGMTRTLNIKTTITSTIPVRQLVARHQVDILIGNWWFLNGDKRAASKASEEYKKEAIKVSVHNAIPCYFTNTAAYEVEAKAPISNNIVYDNNDGGVVHKFIPAGASTSTGTPVEVVRKRQRQKVMAIGTTAILLGTTAALIAFGSIAATSSNTGIADAMDVFSNMGGLGHGLFSGMNDAFGNIDAQSCCCCDIGHLGGDIGNWFEHCGNSIGQAFSGGAIANCGNSIGGVFSNCGNSIGEVFSNCGNMAGAFGDCANGCGNIAGVLGDCANGCGDLAGGACDCIVSMVGAIGD